MGYILTPLNPAKDPFEFGAFSFPILLDACGYLFSCIHNGPAWYCNWQADPSMIGKHPDGSKQDYPTILGGGYKVDAYEAEVMARIAHNFVGIQRTLPESHRGTGLASRKDFKKEDLLKIIMEGMNPTKKAGPWPEKIRDDFTDKIEAFSKWAPTSNGFKIGFTMMVNGVNVAYSEAEDGS